MVSPALAPRFESRSHRTLATAYPSSVLVPPLNQLPAVTGPFNETN